MYSERYSLRGRQAHGRRRARRRASARKALVVVTTTRAGKGLSGGGFRWHILAIVVEHGDGLPREIDPAPLRVGAAHQGGCSSTAALQGERTVARSD